MNFAWRLLQLGERRAALTRNRPFQHSHTHLSVFVSVQILSLMALHIQRRLEDDLGQIPTLRLARSRTMYFSVAASTPAWSTAPATQVNLDKSSSLLCLKYEVGEFQLSHVEGVSYGARACALALAWHL